MNTRGALGFAWLLCVGCGTAPVDAPRDAATPDADVVGDAAPKPVDAAPACTVGLWDPSSGTIDQWPDQRFIAAHSTTATGVRLRVDTARFAPIIIA